MNVYYGILNKVERMLKIVGKDVTAFGQRNKNRNAFGEINL